MLFERIGSFGQGLWLQMIVHLEFLAMRPAPRSRESIELDGSWTSTMSIRRASPDWLTAFKQIRRSAHQ
jgi:hypothetical protein